MVFAPVSFCLDESLEEVGHTIGLVLYGKRIWIGELLPWRPRGAELVDDGHELRYVGHVVVLPGDSGYDAIVELAELLA